MTASVLILFVLAAVLLIAWARGWYVSRQQAYRRSQALQVLGRLSEESRVRQSRSNVAVPPDEATDPAPLPEWVAPPPPPPRSGAAPRREDQGVLRFDDYELGADSPAGAATGAGAGASPPESAPPATQPGRSRLGLAASFLAVVGAAATVVVALAAGGGAGSGTKGVVSHSELPAVTGPRPVTTLPTTTPSVTPPATAAAPSGRMAAPTTVAPAPPPTTESTAPPSTSAPAATSGPPSSAGPAITRLSPSTGAAGQTVMLTGRGLYSPHSGISVMFGGVAGGVSCPTQTACQLTVPSEPPGTADVPVTLSTSTGTSNPVTFTYGP